MSDHKEKKTAQTADLDKELEAYYAQYFDSPYTISAAPEVKVTAGPTQPKQLSQGAPLTLSSIRTDVEGGVPLPEGYNKVSATPSYALATPSIPSVSTKLATNSRTLAAYSKPSEEKQRRTVSLADDSNGKGKVKKTTVLRQGGGETWEDSTLLEWDESELILSSFMNNLE